MISARNLLRAFASIFRKKKIIFLGKRGMTFFDEERIYFINSDVIETDDADVLIYDEGMYYVENDAQVMLTEDERNRLLAKVEAEMKKIGLIAVLPERYIKWKESAH